MAVNFDTSLLLNLYQSRLGTGGPALGGLPTSVKRVAPRAPWSDGDTTPAQQTLAVKNALLGRRLVDENATRLDLPGASQDYRKLFAVYNGLATLEALAIRSQVKGLTTFERDKVEKAFADGMAEIGKYVADADFDKLRLVQGETALTAKTTAPVPRTKTSYTTPPLVTGNSSTEVPGFQGNVQFNIKVKRSGLDIDVPIDLAGMGAQPRTLGNVVVYVNSQLQAAGVDARFESQRIPGTPKTTTVGGKTVTLAPAVDSWALKVNVTIGETVSFSGAATAGAVYVAQQVGDPDPDKKASTNDGRTERQMLKFQTDTATVPGPVQQDGEANWVDGRVYAKNLGPEVAAVHATQVGADGSVYVLADVTAKTGGQDIRGTQDVALLKYDSAGALIYSRTLGASESASGLALAIAADGKIAVAGSVSGVLDGATDGALNSGTSGTYAGKPDSFVTLFDAEGQELWTARRGARAEDEASSIAFGADGTVYVAGRAKSDLPGASALGDWDNYVQAFSTGTDGKPQSVFTHQYGTAGSDKPAGIVVDGTSVVTASLENGHAIVRRYDVSSGSPVLTGTQDLGDLQGGSIAGIALDGTDVVIAGSTANGALNGTVTKGLTGGIDAFAVRLSADLSGPGSVAYYGGTGDDRATSLAVSNGDVWIGGAAGDGAIGALAKLGTADGFLAKLDVDAGTVGWDRRFTGKDGRAAPTAIAVDTSGASVLDRIGLPKGELDMSDSQRLIDQSALRPGDTFTVRVNGGRASTVTIELGETLDTLALKIRRASGFQAKVTVGSADNIRKLTVAPGTDRMVVEFGPGKADRNALELLGIPEGVVRNTKVIDGKSQPADRRGPLFGLGLPADLNLKTPTDYNHARAEIAGAQTAIRNAYKELVAILNPQAAAAQAAAAKVSGPVPAYLRSQISNYQAALSRLTGGA